MKNNENWEELKAESYTNIQSWKGFLNRKIRSIQKEGNFEDIKKNLSRQSLKKRVLML